MKEKVWGIYKITNTKNGKVYIGSSSNIYRRLRDHKKDLRLNKHINKHLQHAYNKYGFESFNFEIVEILEETNKTNSILREKETEYIVKYNSADWRKGYNIVNGGFGSMGVPCPEKTKIAVSKSRKGKVPWNKGIPRTKEFKESLSKIQIKRLGKTIDIYDVNHNFIETLSSVREVCKRYNISK